MTAQPSTDDEVLSELDRLYAKITAALHDDEMCHAYEDDMHTVALKAIAAGTERSAAIAESALRASVLNFARWCA